MQQRLQLAQHRAHAAGGVEVLHVVLAGRLEVDQHRRRSRKARSACFRSTVMPSAAGDRGEVDDRVGRAADRQQHAQRVLDRLRA